MPKILTDKTIDDALGNSNTTVAISVSGGKDSSVLALETNRYLDSIGFNGDRVLIHSDLGEIEHYQSKEICQKLSNVLNLRLHIVKPKRPMIERWQYRWECIVKRFEKLESVKLSTWASSARNRFCTSEEKTSPICSFLKKKFPGQTILNTIGLRREESRGRAAKPISKPLKLLTVKTKGTVGIVWHPILDYKVEDVFNIHKKYDFPLHEAYTKLGMSRVSCSFCVLASDKDLRASLGDVKNHKSFRRIAELEINSTFSFKNDFWIADIATHLLSKSQQTKLKEAKVKAIQRRILEREIPSELLFNSKTGFPAFQPNYDQASKLAEVRKRLGELLGLEVNYATGKEVYNRYKELLEKKERKELKKSKQKSKGVQRVLKW